MSFSSPKKVYSLHRAHYIQHQVSSIQYLPPVFCSLSLDYRQRTDSYSLFVALYSMLVYLCESASYSHPRHFTNAELMS